MSLLLCNISDRALIAPYLQASEKLFILPAPPPSLTWGPGDPEDCRSTFIEFGPNEGVPLDPGGGTPENPREGGTETEAAAATAAAATAAAAAAAAVVLVLGATG
ncbi:hypothetical protein ONE63_000270 [Megalurothrips usitatus]|uniref:Uncharacterized protein n=1 Tax=Megalurothrips usitatus TaxID=439358 RepID=A0AAV7Y1R6_9NEOP|nr:hypothetical protein ONE63_000270 [Megalurothrips usitatus]